MYDLQPVSPGWRRKKKTGTLKAGFLLVLSLVGNWCNKQHCTSYFPIIFYFIWSCAGLKLRIKGSSFIIQTSKTRIGTSDAAFQEKRTNCTWKTCAIHSSSSCTHFSSYWALYMSRLKCISRTFSRTHVCACVWERGRSL